MRVLKEYQTILKTKKPRREAGASSTGALRPHLEHLQNFERHGRDLLSPTLRDLQRHEERNFGI